MNTFNGMGNFAAIAAILAEQAQHSAAMGEQFRKQEAERHRESADFALADKLLKITYGPNRRFFSTVTITDATWSRP